MKRPFVLLSASFFPLSCQHAAVESGRRSRISRGSSEMYMDLAARTAVCPPNRRTRSNGHFLKNSLLIIKMTKTTTNI